MGNGQFKDVSSAKGPGITERFSSRGAAFGDYDNDGDIDVLVLYMNHLPSLLRNDSGNKQNWIKLRLIGTKCIRIAIGARVRVVTGDHSQVDEVHSGSSVMSQSDLACIWHRRSTNRRLNQETDVSYPESVSRGVARRHQSPNES
jgi:hypothetical protein